MGKTPKKAAPGGDERNLYVRRLKATTTSSSSSSKGCDTGLPMKQRESDSSNRSKPSEHTKKRLPVPVGKVFKSKLRSPTRTQSHQAMKNPTRFQPSTSKDDKKLASTTVAASKDLQEVKVVEMHPESEESAVQLKVSITKKDVKEGEKKSSSEEIGKEETEVCITHVNSNGKEVIELTEDENTTPRNEDHQEEIIVSKNIEKPTINETKPIGVRGKDNEITETITLDDESETERPSFESEDNTLKLVDEGEQPNVLENNVVAEEVTTNGQKEENNDENKQATTNVESAKPTETCSVDVVESTTSEASDSGNVTQSEKEPEVGDADKRTIDLNDPSFISYDSSIMLKDVQIKLNDCLKDNSKLFDVSLNDEINDEDREKRLDMSFGRTLRNISGRSTINRLRHVTLREHRFSPNSSLFVNTSRTSLDPEDSASCKLIRYPTDNSDSMIFNGSPADRKRKLVEDATTLTKKQKTEANERGGLLNTSLEMLKGIRRPVQVSTPKTTGYKFQSDNLDFKGFNNEKLIIDAEVEPKKWCVVM